MSRFIYSFSIFDSSFISIEVTKSTTADAINITNKDDNALVIYSLISITPQIPRSAITVKKIINPTKIYPATLRILTIVIEFWFILRRLTSSKVTKKLLLLVFELNFTTYQP